jgi:hypothetical protein
VCFLFFKKMMGLAAESGVDFTHHQSNASQGSDVRRRRRIKRATGAAIAAVAVEPPAIESIILIILPSEQQQRSKQYKTYYYCEKSQFYGRFNDRARRRRLSSSTLSTKCSGI